jgi:hypothetical protein
LTQRDLHARDVTSLVSLLEPRPTPSKLPGPAPAPAVAAAASPAPAGAADDEPADNKSLPGFLHIAMRYDLAMSPPQQHDEIVDRVKRIRTRGEARQYLEDVVQRAAVAKPILAVRHAGAAQLAATAGAAGAAGASFGVDLSPRNGTARVVTQWSVRVEQRQGSWSGTITSGSPAEILQTPGLSGMFDVTVVASGPHLPEKQLAPVPGTRADVGCQAQCRALIGIVATPDGTDAEYWTTWDAVCAPQPGSG